MKVIERTAGPGVVYSFGAHMLGINVSTQVKYPDDAGGLGLVLAASNMFIRELRLDPESGSRLALYLLKKSDIVAMTSASMTVMAARAL